MRALWAGLLIALLAGCASHPTLPERSGEPTRDGPGDDLPRDLLRIPDAQPRIEPIRAGGPNKPYEVDGERYEPLLEDLPFRESGIASWYGKKFHGRRTASGETYNMYAMSAAHPRWPLPSYARVRNPANGREVIVRINDRGPFVRGRVIDLSYTAALKLDLHRGIGRVEIQRLTLAEIRAGRWGEEREEASPPLPATAADAPPLPSTAELRGAEARAPSRGLWLQIGAFRQLALALALKSRVAEAWAEGALLTSTFQDRGLHRVQLGPFADETQAETAARALRERLGLEVQRVRR